MGYATSDDIVDIYGEDLLVRVSDHDEDDEPDLKVVDAGLKSADDIINGYISGRYTVPMVPTPDLLRTYAVDIAIYKMALGRQSRTDEMRLRYEDAILFLKDVSAGKAFLALPPVDSDGDGIPDTNPNNAGRGRFFTLTRG